MDQENSKNTQYKGLTNQQLKNRLQDQGFSLFTIPSVKRLNKKNKDSKPLIARLYSLENNLIKSVKQPQTSIFVNDQITNNNKNPEIQKAYYNQINNGYTTAIQQQNKNENEQMKKREKQKQNLYNERNQISQNQFQQINDKEFKQAKIVLTKLRSTYLEKTKQYRAIKKPIKIDDKKVSVNLLKKTEEKIQIKNNNQQSIKRKYQNELDGYINLLLKNSPSVDQFVYLVQNQDSDDPYDLILKNYFQIVQSDKKNKKNHLPPMNNSQNQQVMKQMNYYTISVKGLCRFKEGKPVEFIALTDWLKERETYDKIRKLGFFADFSKWKTVQVWKKSYKTFKKKVAMKSLEEKLFINFNELKDATFKTKDVLYRMQQIVFLDFKFMKDSSSDTITIEKFMLLQEDKSSQTQQMITELAKECHKIYSKSLEDRLEMLRNEVAKNNDSDNVFKKSNNDQFVQMKENPYERLGFPETMSYDKRSILRKECFRFIKFAYYVDFLAVDCLTKIYLNSIQLFINEVSKISNQKQPTILRDFDKQKQVGIKEAIFKIEIDHHLNFEDLEHNFKKSLKSVQDFKFPKIEEAEQRPEDFKEYNLITYPFVIDYDDVEDFNEQKKKFLEYGDNQKFQQETVDNIQNVCMNLRPSLNRFLENLDKILLDGINCLQSFLSFAKHPTMKKYYAILEEWEENDDNSELIHNSNLLNPVEWIDIDIKNFLEGNIKKIFRNEYMNAENYLSTFQQYLQIMYEYKNINYEILLSKNLAKPGMTYKSIINLLLYQQQLFENEIPYLADLGLFRVESTDFKNDLMNKPQEVQEDMIKKLFAALKDRFLNCKEWFSQSQQQLRQQVTDIEQFVNQINYSINIGRKFDYYKDQVNSSKEIIDIIKKFQIEIPKDVQGLQTECKNLEQNLAQQKTSVDENISKTKSVYVKQINDQTVPELKEKCENLQQILCESKYIEDSNDDITIELKNYLEMIQEYQNQYEQICEYKKVLEMPSSKIEQLQQTKHDIQIKILLRESYKEWFQNVKIWKETLFKEVDIEQIQQCTEQQQKNISKIRKIVPMTNILLSELDTNVKDFLSLIPIVSALRNEKLNSNHLKQIEELIQQNLDFKIMTLKDFLSPNILDQQKQIIGISVQVTQESILKQRINEVEKKFGQLVFPLIPFKEDNPKDSTYILGDTTDLVNEVDMLIMTINQVYGSRYLLEYKKQASDKRKDILMLQEILMEWIKFQRSYIYLESIFSQPEIKKPLQLEVKEFDDQINKVYKSNIKKIIGIQSIAQLTKQKLIENYLQTFKKQNIKLNQLNNKINNFLDLKREKFPRFYIVANDELIYILANYDQAPAVQSFVGKLFENIHHLDFADDKAIVFNSIISREGEIFPLNSSVNIKSESVEKWLEKLESLIKKRLFQAIKEGLQNYIEQPREDWYLKSSAQITSVITQYAWTINTESFLKNLELGDSDDLTEIVGETQSNLETLINLVRKPLQPAQRSSIVALITTEVHNRNILEELIKENVTSINQFLWQQQLRYYFDEHQDRSNALLIKQINATQQYGYEYYGPCSRIVITPLTDRCWITITSALHMKLGSAPQGPAGTGKTESTKDLAKSLGRFCLVFNCSDQIDYKMMERLFRGIIQLGAWTCLDEFNRIDIEVLSVISQQLLEMRLALLQFETGEQFSFGGAPCTLVNTCGVFITMNPGYAGRTELPDNLKALFRPIAMMIPDYRLIAEILLFSEGFLESKILAGKMIKLYKLSSEQLSQQKHYDFGLRSVKSVLVMAGKLKAQDEEGTADENLLLIKALMDSNIPKFLKQDLPLFNALISDLFPDIQIPKHINETLLGKCSQILKDQQLDNSEDVMEKINQLSETMNVRFGTMVVGKALTGKSVVIKTLIDGINDLNSIQDPENPDTQYPKIKCITINPKSVTMGELYGEETANKDWIDGLASHYIRLGTSTQGNNQTWICFDGPVDSLWIENMNSVLDDSRMLCLPNGQRIRLNNKMRILFEVDCLQQASPATISRCGMVYVQQEVLGWQSLVNSWIQKLQKNEEEIYKEILNEENLKFIQELFNNNIESFINYFNNLDKPIEIITNQCIISFCNLLQSLIFNKTALEQQKNEEQKQKFLEINFVFATAWSFAGCLNDKEAEKFDNYIKKKFMEIQFSADSITNCYIDYKDLTFKLYSSQLQKHNIDQSKSFWEILVPTVDTNKLSNIIGIHLDWNRNIFLVGDSGTGKTVLAQNLLKQYNVDKNIDTLKFNFSAQTLSRTVQDTLMDGLFLLSQKSRGARFGRKNVVYIDDVNMPQKEVYGAQPPIELLRQFFDFGFFYDRKEKNTITVSDTYLFCLAAPPEGGRNPLSARFTRHFNILCFPNARNFTISRIFNSIFESYLDKFDPQIKGKAHDIVNASIEFYEKICTEKLPTPSKFHYTFNLRDLSKVFMGLSLAQEQNISNQTQLIQLWAHELQRVFKDRLNTQDDREWFDETVETISQSILGIRPNVLQLNEIIFSEVQTLQDEDIVYEQINDIQKLIKNINDFQMDYNDKNRNKLNLVFFKQALDHFLRILRILRSSRGNALLIGVGGLGKQSLARLTSFIANYQFTELQQTGNFNQEQFKEFLRKDILLECAGADKGPQGKPTSLLITDSSISNQAILEDINNLLNSGEIPNLFLPEDKEKIQTAIIDLYSQKNIVIDQTEAWKQFIERVRNNLHIIMCMSPVGENLKIWCRQFPALVSCCTIDWFDQWSGVALESVSQKLLEKKKFENIKELSKYIKIFHQEGQLIAEEFSQKMRRKFYITPKTALDNIELFVKLYEEKKQDLQSRIEDFKKGSVKLDEMSVVVAQLKIDLKKAQPELEKQQKLASVKLIELEKASKIANEKKQTVEKDAQEISIEKEKIKKVSDKANASLSESLPRIKKAENEVMNIDRKQLNILRNLSTPPKMIEFIFSTVCLALGEKYVNWKDTGRRMIKDLNKFIEKLIKKIEDIKQKGGSAVPSSTLKNLEKNLQNEFFSEKKLETNIIAKPLGMWCHAIYDFTVLKKQVEPLEKEVQQMQEKLDKATAEYNKVAADLDICNKEFQSLQDDFNQMQKKQKELQDTIEQSKIKLIRAEKLTDLLQDEGKRWKQSVEQLTEDLNTLTGDIFISASYISYIGPLSLIYRQKLKNNWIQQIQNSKILLTSKNYSFLKIMGDPLTLQNWTLQGLPSDEISLSSGILATKCIKYPFLIDPQFQATKWLKNQYEKDDNFIVTKCDESPRRFQQIFKQALQNGQQILLEECKEKIPGSLEPVVNKLQFFNNLDQQMMINFNEENILFSDNFNLFLITKFSNPEFLPDVFIKTNVVNFTVTQKGLEDQLLAEVMKLERPEDEKTKNLNVQKISKFQQNMKELESKILILLVQCENSPVEDENLVETLQYSKKVAKEITQKLIQIEEIDKKFQTTRESFRSVAEAGSIIFFVVQELSQIDPMYQYSLQAITKLFKNAISKTTEQGDTRLKVLQENIIKTIYDNVQRGVFVAHKSILSFLLAISLQLQTGKLDNERWELFLKGCGVIDRSKQQTNPDPELIGQFDWDLLNILDEKFDQYKGIVDSVVKGISTWKKQITSKTFNIQDLPDEYGSKLDNFDRLLIIKIFKPSLLLDQIKEYIEYKLGTHFLNSRESSPEQIYQESDNQTPIVFVLSKGADPSSMVKKLGEQKGFELYDKLIPISLGQGQGQRASRLIEVGKTEGHWILLENCHLAKTWMPALEKQIQNITAQQPEDIHQDFRLFLTSMPASYFPISILQNSMKITTEPPKGIKANVIRSVQNIKDDYITQAKQENILGKMVMGLCFFHAIVQERRKFGPLGWNIPYEFNNSDIEAASNILSMFLEDIENKRDIPWDSLVFLTGTITYGGRVSDDLDQRLLFCTLLKFYNENILNDHYRFCPFDTYKIPKEASKDIYMQFAENLPVNDSPEVFGLHPNANITYKNQEVFRIFETVKLVMSASENSQRVNKTEKIRELITKFLSSDSMITQQLLFKEGHKRHFQKESNGLIPSLSTVLMQELARFNILTNKITTSLQNLDLAVQGKITMSAELDMIYNSLLENKVPESWKAVSYPSLKSLSSWFENLQQRIQFMQQWLMEETIIHFWLPGLFFPQGFLTGVLQTHARKTNEPIDQFVFTFKATDYYNNHEEIIKPEDGVLISGLFLEGGNWDLKRKGIADSVPGKMFVEMPMIHFLPKNIIETKNNLYPCPLYKTTDRAGTLSTTGQSTNFILIVNLPCDKTPDVWIMKGVALFCELRE